MKKIFLFIVTAIITVSPANGGLFDWLSSSPKGMYRTADNKQTLNITTGSDLEVHDGDGTYPGTYKLDGDTLRAEFTISGTPRVFYFKKVTEGWLERDGPMFFGATYFDAIQLARQAHDKYEKQDVNGAIADYTKALESCPNYSDAYAGRGDAKRFGGDRDGAIADYKLALQIDPNNQNATSSLNETLELVEQDKRTNFVKQIGSPEPRLSELNEEKELPTDTEINSLQTAVQNSPQDSTAQYNLAMAYIRLKRYEDAIGPLNVAHDASPDNAKIRRAQGFNWIKTGSVGNAEEDLAKAIDLDPKAADAYFNLALVQATHCLPSTEYGRIRMENARVEYKKALELGGSTDAQLEGLLK